MKIHGILRAVPPGESVEHVEFEQPFAGTPACHFSMSISETAVGVSATCSAVVRNWNRDEDDRCTGADLLVSVTADDDAEVHYTFIGDPA